ncbi:uncharacterized protein LOC133824948 [Humulus lupulus]|uniref:uncharacterized protein LOC133824948 n=1 Tax=Humulus lupulus TaxID=3486 RepID=UPI002B40D976|nr:uncharacterized protein LOC133824948 [Humulus lupulus]
MKKLKIWPRKKRKRKAHHPLPYYLPPPPSRPPPPPPPLQAPILHWCCSCSKAEPSAPPLPSSWYCDSPGEAHESVLAAGVVEYPSSAADAGDDDGEDLESSSSSYQQYMVPSPVYGIPVPVLVSQRERSGGVFSCVINFGRHLFGCFFPCYRI